MSEPVIVLVGGGWHTAEYLKPLAAPFNDAGYETKTVSLPSAGANPPHIDFSHDVAAIRRTVKAVIAAGRDVVVGLHSLSGIPGTEALHGLGKPPSGGRPGVLAIVYIAAHVPAKGNNSGQHMISMGDETWAQARAAFGQNGVIMFPQDIGKALMYNDIDDREAQYWISLIVPQSLGTFDSPLTYDTYNEIPSGYIACKLDLAYSYGYQSQNVVDRGFPSHRVLHINAGHTPWLTRPTEVCDFVLQVAREAAREWQKVDAESTDREAVEEWKASDSRVLMY